MVNTKTYDKTSGPKGIEISLIMTHPYVYIDMKYT